VFGAATDGVDQNQIGNLFRLVSTFLRFLRIRRHEEGQSHQTGISFQLLDCPNPENIDSHEGNSAALMHQLVRRNFRHSCRLANSSWTNQNG
jgi:hypothetical protein